MPFVAIELLIGQVFISFALVVPQAHIYNSCTEVPSTKQGACYIFIVELRTNDPDKTYGKTVWSIPLYEWHQLLWLYFKFEFFIPLCPARRSFRKKFVAINIDSLSSLP